MVKALRYAMLFGVYGSLIGAAFLFLVVMQLEFGKGGVSGYLHAVPMILLSSIWIVPIALIVGMVPGTLTGVTYWWLNTRTFVARWPAPVRAAIMAVAGGAACVVLGVCLGATVTEMLSREAVEMFVAPGMVAAAVCTVLADLRIRAREE